MNNIQYKSGFNSSFEDFVYKSSNDIPVGIAKKEEKALSDFCKIGLKVDGGICKNDDINAAIASLNWVDTAQAKAYITCIMENI